MNFEIRELKEPEYPLLENFLYEAIYVPEGFPRPDRGILKTPEMRVYLDRFGYRSGDYGLAAVMDNEVVGVIWGRIMNDYGHIDDETPSLALAVHEPFRGHGIGTALLISFLKLLRADGYRQVSLSVQRSNPAMRLYERIGFETCTNITVETAEEVIMRCELNPAVLAEESPAE